MMVSIDRAGRVVIPKEVRDQLDLDVDSELELAVDADTIVIRRVRRAGRRVIEVDGWPMLEPTGGPRLTDADVQAWRDADQR
jgi:AbrB family looped-hinge helix DNA binding protein